MLPEPVQTGPVRVISAPGRRSQGWAIPALAVAAALAIALVIVPKRAGDVSPAVPAAPPLPAAAQAQSLEPAEVAVQPAVLRHPMTRRSAAKQPVLRADYFLPLDNEPIETGVVVRVGLENSDLQADLIVGPDGRARAIRLVSNK